ncbi:hypothetical protein NDU88_001416 [Pleurodeles waltl]|uniref:Uncharacterized protein n=1 Tax=Pleurodeles waltl TaxID=8319 RepID=A0AAV7RCI7_PLEWA|nr:hypothetical protein NDU88_001416 [Pleurodeles waltl]
MARTEWRFGTGRAEGTGSPTREHSNSAPQNLRKGPRRTQSRPRPRKLNKVESDRDRAAALQAAADLLHKSGTDSEQESQSDEQSIDSEPGSSTPMHEMLYGVTPQSVEDMV